MERLNKSHLHPLLEHPETDRHVLARVFNPRPSAPQVSTLAKSYYNRLCHLLFRIST
jgi:hypothetical protein